VTCSSASESVSRVRDQAHIPVVAADEAMLDAAVGLGPRVGLLATARTTLGPSERGLIEAAERAGVEIEVTTRFVEGALPALLDGDPATHDELVTAAARALAPEVDVIVLAQATMARVLPRLAVESPGTAVLASPILALGSLRRLLMPDAMSLVPEHLGGRS
jgi:Asp/Glu/hydantoin racemase